MDFCSGTSNDNCSSLSFNSQSSSWWTCSRCRQQLSYNVHIHWRFPNWVKSGIILTNLPRSSQWPFPTTDCHVSRNCQLQHFIQCGNLSSNCSYGKHRAHSHQFSFHYPFFLTRTKADQAASYCSITHQWNWYLPPDSIGSHKHNCSSSFLVHAACYQWRYS